jgi:FHS family glucose/mannose:H+ symporter-like MFS transporter
MIRNIKIITAFSFTAMLFLGVAGSLIGAAARNIGLSPLQINLMLVSQNVGFMVSVLITGALADTYAKPRILFFGSLILAAAFLVFYMSGNFGLNLLIMFFIGIGIGTYEGSTDAMLLDIHTQREGLFINLNHFFVTFGSILITVYLIFLEMNWRTAVTQSGIVVILLAVLFFFTKVQAKAKHAESYINRMKIITRERLLIGFFIATIIIVGAEAGTVGNLTTFLMDLRGFTQLTSKFGLILFLVGMAIGRLILGFITPKHRISLFILGLLASSAVIYGLLYFLDLGTYTYLLIFLAGMSLSASLPLILTQAGITYPDMSGTVLGAIKVAIPIGGFVIPALIALLVRTTSFSFSLIVFPLSFLFAFVMLSWIMGKSIFNSEETVDLSP